MKRILITGAAGRIGKALCAGLKQSDLMLRLCDVVTLDDVTENEEFFVTDITNINQLEQVMENIDCVVHLAGIPGGDDWENLLPNNIQGTFNVFEAARRKKIKRVIYASSNRVISFYRKEKILNNSVMPRPDNLYGVTKVFGEALGRLYADKYGLSVICIRIGSFEDQPKNERHLRTWLSPNDFVQLVQRCIEANSIHFEIVYGVSANTQSRWDNSPVNGLLHYKPIDNAENYASNLQKTDKSSSSIANLFHGGEFCEIGFVGSVDEIT